MAKRSNRLHKTAQKTAVFKWTEQRERAAILVAQDEKIDEAIAAEVGISRRTLADWKCAAAFVARVDSLVREAREAIRSRGIAIIENRVKALQDRWERMRRIIDERSADPEMQDVPGGQTGLLTHDVKSVGAERVDLYAVDAALLKELREHEKQAAQELGQHTEKHEHTGPGGGPLRHAVAVDLTKLSDDELAKLRELRLKVATEPGSN